MPTLSRSQITLLDRWFTKQNGYLWDKKMNRYARSPETNRLYTDKIVATIATGALDFEVTATNMRSCRLSIHPKPDKFQPITIKDSSLLKDITAVLRKHGVVL